MYNLPTPGNYRVSSFDYLFDSLFCLNFCFWVFEKSLLYLVLKTFSLLYYTEFLNIYMDYFILSCPLLHSEVLRKRRQHVVLRRMLYLPGIFLTDRTSLCITGQSPDPHNDLKHSKTQILSKFYLYLNILCCF